MTILDKMMVCHLTVDMVGEEAEVWLKIIEMVEEEVGIVVGERGDKERITGLKDMKLLDMVMGDHLTVGKGREEAEAVAI